MQIAQLETSLASIPSVTATASCLVDGELNADVFEGDVVTCRAHVLLSRPSHATAGADRAGRRPALCAMRCGNPDKRNHVGASSDDFTWDVGRGSSQCRPCILRAIVGTDPYAG